MPRISFVVGLTNLVALLGLRGSAYAAVALMLTLSVADALATGNHPAAEDSSSPAMRAAFSKETAAKPTRTQLTISPSPSTAGDTVNLTAVVVTPDASRPRGAVQFYADLSLLGTVALSGEAEQAGASIALNDLSPGTYRFSAKYVGHPEFLPSASLPATHVVSGR